MRSFGLRLCPWQSWWLDTPLPLDNRYIAMAHLEYGRRVPCMRESVRTENPLWHARHR